MSVAKGMSNAQCQIEILAESMQKMISDTENQFKNRIDRVKAALFDIYSDGKISHEERKSLSSLFYSELELLEQQLNETRCKLFICIYSICEASLRDICLFYKIPLRKKEPLNNKISKSCKTCEHAAKQTSKDTHFYLLDYLFTLNRDLNKESAEYIISNPYRRIRNQIIHGGKKLNKLGEDVKELNDLGFPGIKEVDNKLIIEDSETLPTLLKITYNLLRDCEKTAKEI